MNKLLDLRIKSLSIKVSKKFNLYQIVELLEKYKIEIKGNITNTSKKKIVEKSLKNANQDTIEKVIEKIESEIGLKEKIDKEGDTLHKDLKGSKVETFLKNDVGEEAVRVAFVRVNNRVKKMSGLSQLDGAALMRSAFSKNNPVLKVNSLTTQHELDEQEGLMHIFAGSMLAFRNPSSHDDEKKISPDDASKVITLASYLMSVLDKVQAQK